jgi:hypothetical protein
MLVSSISSTKLQVRSHGTATLYILLLRRRLIEGLPRVNGVRYAALPSSCDKKVSADLASKAGQKRFFHISLY